MKSTFRILITDDDRQNRTLLKRILEKEGFEQLLEAESGKQALELVKQNACDILLLDISMSELNGLETCTQIRKDFSPSELPILFITASSKEEDIIKGFAVGANDYIAKPVHKPILLARVKAQAKIVEATRNLLKAKEQIAEKAAMETIGRLSAGVAHNFNNILGTILGSAEIH